METTVKFLYEPCHKCIPYNNRCVQNFIQISWDLAVRGPKNCLE